MNVDDVWQLVERARIETSDSDDCSAVAEQAARLLAQRTATEIEAFAQLFWDLMAIAHCPQLWAAAHAVRSDWSARDFDAFLAWLILRGRVVFNQVLSDPDSLAQVPAADQLTRKEPSGCPAMLAAAGDAYKAATAQELPLDRITIRYAETDLELDFDLDDPGQLRARFPQLTARFPR